MFSVNFISFKNFQALLHRNPSVFRKKTHFLKILWEFLCNSKHWGALWKKFTNLNDFKRIQGIFWLKTKRFPQKNLKLWRFLGSLKQIKRLKRILVKTGHHWWLWRNEGCFWESLSFFQKKFLMVLGIYKRFYPLRRIPEKSLQVWRFWKVLLKFRHTKNIDFSA